jgi:hypothetical protein
LLESAKKRKDINKKKERIGRGSRRVDSFEWKNKNTCGIYISAGESSNTPLKLCLQY